MVFPQEELLAKYVRIREQLVDSYQPDFKVADGTTRYVRFNDHWRGTNPYSRFLIPRLMDRKNTFPKTPSAKLAKNANPENYVTLQYDSSGALKTAWLGKYNDLEQVYVYASKQLTIGYLVRELPGCTPSYRMTDFEWCEYDDLGRLIGVEEYRSSELPTDDVIINCEYYEYDGDVLSRAWCFKDFQKYPMQMTLGLVQQLMPDRIMNPEQIECSFRREADGLDYTYKHHFRKSQTITHEGHVSGEMLSHLADQGIQLV